MSSAMSLSSRLGSQVVRELRVHLCQKSPSSEGVREYIRKFYPELKQQHPKVPVLVRECSGIEPRLWVRFDFGQETSFGLNNESAESIRKLVQQQLGPHQQ